MSIFPVSLLGSPRGLTTNKRAKLTPGRKIVKLTGW